ncbi:MAG: NTP transferase domain-containing protein, partial [Bdellovibrionales bacterium]|nr:NTP transferase domain-containing protein [Bdellovibrionales bacterium]
MKNLELSASEPLAVVVLAAGHGKRMGGQTPKVLVDLYGTPIIGHVLESVIALDPQKIICVVGFEAKLVEKTVREQAKLHGRDDILFALQPEPRGTGDALRSALKDLKDFTGTVLIVCGDVPLVTSASLEKFLKAHFSKKSCVSFISQRLLIPGSYGRVLRDSDSGEVLAIREAKDCTEKELLVDEINSGIYAVDSSFLA